MDLSLWPVAALVGELLLKLAMIAHILLRRPSRPASNLAWIVVILAVPLLGIVGYLLVGEARLSRRRVARHAERQRRVRARVPLNPRRTNLPDMPALYAHIATLATAVADNDPVGGNALRLIGDAGVFVETLVADIDAARDHCHLLFYIYLDDESGHRVADALERAAQRGVVCRVLVDAVGSRPFARSRLRRRMQDAGVRVVEALPTNVVRMLFARLDLRNHRKITVIDGTIGYVGSQNIADPAFAPKRRFAPWVDATVRVEGPAARDLQVIFAEDWFLDTNERLDDEIADTPPGLDEDVVIQVMGTGPNSYNEALPQLTLSAFHAAREELILTTPYFVPDPPTAVALTTAARRGVETTLIVPARNDSPLVAAASRSHYEPLLRAGVRILEFQEGLLHAKTLTVDRSLALITTANMDRRSFELNFEVSMVVYDSDFASELRFLQTSYIDRSIPVDLAAWERRSPLRRLWQNAAGTLSPLL